ncbi:MAG: hypothetical protein ACYDCD_00620 [Candidatus Acidiferrales bacterium]
MYPVEDYLASSASVAFPELSKFLISLDEIKFDGTVFRLNAPIQIAIYVEDGLWNCEQKDFSSLSFGPTLERAIHSFREDFAILWHEIAQAPDEDLTGDAQRVKRALLSAVKTVETE